MNRLLATLLLAATWPCTGCDQTAAKEQPALVFAAASLTASFTAMAKEFEQRIPGASLQLVFEGTPDLVRKLRDGARADVLASADETNMQKVVAAGQTLSVPVPFAKNVLTIVVQKGNPKGIRTLADLADKDLKVLLCGPAVPAGGYAREALKKANVAMQPVSDEPNVKSVVAKVQLGEADAGIVYVTDTAAAGDKVTAVAIPDEHNVVATYPIALLSTGEHVATGQAFLAFVTSAKGRRILQSFGFRSP